MSTAGAGKDRRPHLMIAQEPTADELISSQPFALLVAMLLDQQYPMEHAFRGPAKIVARCGSIDVHEIAQADPAQFEELCAAPPAIHRYGRSMARRVQAMAQVVVDTYAGDAEAIWLTAESTKELLARLTALPGFGDQKARIFAALLGKQLGIRADDGWREVIGPYAEEGSFRSVADVVDADSLQKVREAKKAAKAAARTTA